MKKQVLFILAAFSVVQCWSQSAKNLVYDANAQVRSVGSFNGLDVSSAIAVYISQGSETAVAISGAPELRDKVKTEVKDGILKISLEGGSNFWHMWRETKRVKAYVTVKDLRSLTVSGASTATITDRLSTDELRVSVSGASSLQGAIAAKNMKMQISGASSARLTGSADVLAADVNGASSLRASEFTAATCHAEASGASDMRLNVSKEFTSVRATGASTIRYSGDAIARNIESSGASSIKKQ